MGHFYNHQGEACHFQTIKTGKNKGKQRATRITDARKLKLMPSVSEYTSMLAKPHLVGWKAGQVLSRAFDMPPIGRETKQGWVSGILADDAAEFQEEVLDRGSIVHAAIEDILKHEPGDEPLPQSEIYDIARPVADVVFEKMERDNTTVESEKIVWCSRLGVAGMSDCPHSDGTIDDFKGKDFKGEDTVKPSLENRMQLAAYYVLYNYHDREGGWDLDASYFAPCRNIFFDRKVPGKVYVHTWSPEELAEGWEAFLACQTLYRIAWGYDARQNNGNEPRP